MVIEASPGGACGRVADHSIGADGRASAAAAR